MQDAWWERRWIDWNKKVGGGHDGTGGGGGGGGGGGITGQWLWIWLLANGGWRADIANRTKKQGERVKHVTGGDGGRSKERGQQAKWTEEKR